MPSLPSGRFQRLALSAILLRLALYHWGPPLAHQLADRIELATPLTSYKRLTEGLFLHGAGFDPYDGHVFFQPALYLPLFSLLYRVTGTRAVADGVVALLFAVMDVLVAYQLVAIARAKWRREPVRTLEDAELSGGQKAGELVKATVDADAEPDSPAPAFPEDINLRLQPETLALLYLFNPLTLFSCLARSTLIFNSFAVVCALRHALEDRPAVAAFWVAVASYISFYPVMLSVPIVMILVQNRPNKLPILVQFLAVFTAALTLLLGASYLITGSWKFLGATYGVILLVTDLTPNLGVFWYFFIEMFDHFRLFFLMAFQLHTLIFAIPVAIRFQERPLFAAVLIVAITTLFKSYPSVADMSLLLGLVPLYYEIFKYMRYAFVLSNAMVYALVLAPLFWHLWIYQGSGNANFFYAATLVYAASQILLVIDLVQSMIRRDIDEAYPSERNKLIVQE